LWAERTRGSSSGTKGARIAFFASPGSEEQAVRKRSKPKRVAFAKEERMPIHLLLSE
jgi:hypothetical protein